MAHNVAVGKGEIGGTIVIGGRKIPPGGIVEAIDKETVVDGVAVLVEKDEDVGRVRDVSRFKELDVVGIESVGELAGITDHGIHRHAADARSVGCWRSV